MDGPRARGPAAGRGRGRGGVPPRSPGSAWAAGVPGGVAGSLFPGGRGRAGTPARPPTPVARGQPGPNMGPAAGGVKVARGGASTDGRSAQQRFHEAQLANQAAARKFTSDCDRSTSSDDDDDDEDNDVKEAQSNTILDSALRQYTGQAGTEGAVVLERTRQLLEECLQSGALSCLVCISSVKRTHAVWSCMGCYSVFHLPCVQQWARDSARLAVPSPLSPQLFPAVDTPWHCPKCRHEYTRKEAPSVYYCWCGREPDPRPDPWLVPHSCGEVCNRELRPSCGHRCLLLCHPGPCPPCPQVVRVPCHCGGGGIQSRRCGGRAWSCGTPCGRALPCRQHKCSVTCHAGECPLCPHVSSQLCCCGTSLAMRPCSSPEWQCIKVCGKAFDCGVHTCELVCHAGACGSCPRSGERSCPCGKTRCSLPCTEEVLLCGDTCGRLLSCGVHTCAQRCHRGPCDTCRQVVEKVCRCGRHSKAMPCLKEYLCDTRCTQQRTCQRHACRRKCCDGNCPQCDQVCARSLSCKNHKCSSICHPGSCYPCGVSVEVSCACGSTKVTVPCGREKHTRPPRCKQLCSAQSDCHHAAREPHRCHGGLCPPCRQTCRLPLKPCGHVCPAPCHDNDTLAEPAAAQRAGPWELPAPVVKRAVSCPPCMQPTPTKCLGGHEESALPCHAARPSSCGRACGRLLACGNHTCSLVCHAVTGSGLQAGPECAVCEEGCARSRPEGCTHRCKRRCHLGPCPACTHTIRTPCHCTLVSIHLSCSELLSAGETERDKLLSCKNQCPRKLECGHRCRALCHPGACPTGEACTHRVRVRCACTRIKKDSVCWKVQTGQLRVDCDEGCEEEKHKLQQVKLAEEQAALEEEEKKKQAELESYARLFGKKRRRERSQALATPAASHTRRNIAITAIATTIIAIIASAVSYIYKD
uniref:NF-X1-type zinc finger protein NFXL1 n=1 Tax=Petromyzon marinus TaxID=7757 RepID=A0AAJ7U3W9_PETMA|nr:NF-X1-type zinc finger protein NFXL1 [Petromyzon marinus]